MSLLIPNPFDAQTNVAERADQLLREQLQALYRGADRLFVLLMLLQWAGGIVAALVISPRTWIGSHSSLHLHVWAAVFLGGALSSFPIWLAWRRPGRAVTRHVIAATQMIWSALLIHLTGGRIETHFHVFGSLAILAFYRDPRVLLTATIAVALDHFVRGVWWPQSVFGVVTASPWRWVEHAAWVLFEVAFLIRSCRRGSREMGEIAHRQAALEQTNALIRREVERQTAELNHARCTAENANRSKSEFLANMSHEIRTPMTAILGYTDLLRNEDVAPADREEYLNVIHRNGDHLLTIINDILDLSKIEAGRMEVERIPTSLWQVVDEVVSLMRVRALNKKLHLAAEFVFPVPEIIRTDPVRLRQVLMNLIGNAIKFTNTGGVRLIIRVDADQHTPRILFEVIDSGIGMTPAQIQRLFQPFVQADSSTTRRFGGTGLGLTVSKRLAEKLGGDIVADSVPEQGSSFRFTIDPGPLEGVRMILNAREAGQLDSDTDDTPDPAHALAGRVLLAEDGPDNQRLISFILRKAGLNVDIADNGQAALDMVLAARDHGEHYDAVLMDMQMPVMDGYTATRKLREAGVATPIIALTAHAMSDDRAKCLDAGCCDYATKPIDKPKLLALLRTHTQRRQQAAA